MVTNEIYDYLQTEKGVAELYKKFEKCFKAIDDLSDTFLKGDLLDENELALALDKSTGAYSKLCPIANAIESYMERHLHNDEHKCYGKLDKIRPQDVSVAKAKARSGVSDIRDYLSDFKSYLLASQQNILSAQSRLKRLVVESGAKRIARHGEISTDDSSPSQKAWDE